MLANSEEGPCTEPDGNEVIRTFEGQLTETFAHDAMIRETGQCPWCLEEEDV